MLFGANSSCTEAVLVTLCAEKLLAIHELSNASCVNDDDVWSGVSEVGFVWSQLY